MAAVRVLFVCTGNLCRSPMAEAMLRHAVEERGCRDVEASSAGTWAAEGYGATTDAADVLGEKGIDLTAHVSRPLRSADLQGSDLVVAMTSVHAREIAELDRDGLESYGLTATLAS
ncbi:MAG: hypothetical protein M3290_12805 [Actinomycetota bacterium]|nr:hypothetical protein [Actinomycetota bacterium]